MKVVAAYNIKGGVGKTSAAVNIGYLAARDGLRTLLWDLDPQGSATYLFRVKPRVKGGSKTLVAGGRALEDAIRSTNVDGLDLLPADFRHRNLDLDLDGAKHSTDRLRRLVRPLADDYDLVVIDCPPSASLVSENVVRASDVLLVPLIPAMLSVRTFDQLTEFVADLPGRPPEIVGFLSMVDRRKRVHRELAEELPRTRAGVRPVAVPNLSVVEQMAEHQLPVPAFAPRSAATLAYEDLWRHLRGTWDGAAAPAKPARRAKAASSRS